MADISKTHYVHDIDDELTRDRTFSIEFYESYEAEASDNFGKHAESQYVYTLEALSQQPATLHGFYVAVQEVIDRLQETTGVPANKRWRLVKEYPSEELGNMLREASVVITYKLKSRRSARLTEGARQGTGKKFQVAQVEVPELPDHKVGVLLEFIDHEIEFVLWTTDNGHLTSVGPAFEQMLKSNTAYFANLGVMRLRWMMSGPDTFLNVGQQRLVGYRAVFSVRLAEMELESTPKINCIQMIGGTS